MGTTAGFTLSSIGPLQYDLLTNILVLHKEENRTLRKPIIDNVFKDYARSRDGNVVHLDLQNFGFFAVADTYLQLEVLYNFLQSSRVIKLFRNLLQQQFSTDEERKARPCWDEAYITFLHGLFNALKHTPGVNPQTIPELPPLTDDLPSSHYAIEKSASGAKT